MADDRRVLIRGWGSDVTHVATVPAAAVATYTWLTDDEFEGVPTPVVTACGAMLRAAHGQHVVMVLARGKVRCPRCRRLTGVVDVDESRAKARPDA